MAQSLHRGTPDEFLGREEAGSPSQTLREMGDLFRAETRLEVYFLSRNPSTQEWEEKGFSGAVQMPAFCQLVRSVPEGLARCAASHREMAQRAGADSCLTTLRCHANLLCFSLPVSILGNGKGCLQTTGVLGREERSQRFPLLYKKVADLGLRDDEMTEFIDGMKEVSPHHLEHIPEWLDLFGTHLAEGNNGGRGGVSASQATLYHQPPTANSGAGQDLLSIREHAGRRAILPAPQSNRSCGFSAAVAEGVAEFVEQHYALPATGQAVAQILGFEASYFGKSFKKHRHISLAKHVQQVRLLRAKTLLGNPYIALAEIAKRTGFSDASYFIRVFRKVYGMTPSQFRKTVEDGAES